MDPNQQGWDQDESIKKVGLARHSKFKDYHDNRLYCLQMTMLHNMVESSKGSNYWTDNALIQAVIGIWFAAAHQPWIVECPSHKTKNSLGLSFENRTFTSSFLNSAPAQNMSSSCGMRSPAKVLLITQQSAIYLSQIALLKRPLGSTLQIKVSNLRIFNALESLILRTESEYSQKSDSALYILKWRPPRCPWRYRLRIILGYHAR